MSFSRSFLNITSHLKPVLIKILPLSFWHRLKEYYMGRRTARLKNEAIIPYEEGFYPEGINLVAPIREESGLGQSARLLAGEISGSGIPFVIISHQVTDVIRAEDHSMDKFVEAAPKYGINILHINPYVFTVSYYQLGKSLWDCRYNIAYWLWELPEFPKRWRGCIDILDEIWTPSEFVSASLRKVTDKPVITIPYKVEAPVNEKYDRKYFGLPKDKFLFLMMYDSSSMQERKNPYGVLEAFKRAFYENADGLSLKTEASEVGIIIKMKGADRAEIDRVRTYLKGYDNLYFLTETYSKVEVNSLIAVSDAFVSLHRAEGFGLVMAEAMMVGTPCVATNWSANTEFMNSDVACMVGYELVPLAHDIGPYDKGSVWAEPDVAEAASYMKKLYEDREFAEDLAARAKAYIRERLGNERITEIINERFKQIVGTHDGKFSK